MLTTIYHILLDADHNPISNGRVQIQLSWNVRDKRNPRYGDSFVTKTYDTITSPMGMWEMVVIPGVDIDPSETLYRVVQRTNRGDKVVEDIFIDVPSSASPVAVADVIVPKPGWEN